MKILNVSVVVACRNEARHIRSFFDSCLKQITNDISCEFLIADGVSEDGTRAVLDEYEIAWPNVRVIDNPERIVSTGLNRAILAAQGDVVIRMDAHTEYAPDYIASCVKLLFETGADNVGGPARTHASGRMGLAIAAAFSSRFSCGGSRFHSEGYEGYVDTVPYGCWRKTTLLELGLFDTTLVRNQDDELNLRLIRKGGKIWQSPQIMSWYHPRSSLRSLFCQYFQYGFWKMAVIRKHHLPASWRHLVPGLFVACMLFLPVFSVLAGIAGANVLGRLAEEVWLLTLIAYLLTSFGVSLWVASRKCWSLISLLPIVFAVYHFAYGIGFLVGFCRKEQTQSGRNGNIFQAMTR